MGYRDYRDIDLIRQMEHEMQKIADETLRGFFAEIPAPNKFWQPRVDVHETQASIVVKVELAGVRPERISVSLESDDRILKVSGERYEEDFERTDRIRCYQLEIYFGPFERQILLPGDARIDRDRITATFREGFLVVTLPKRDGDDPEARTIPITE
jgi:HSP20 family protein